MYSRRPCPAALDGMASSSPLIMLTTSLTWIIFYNIPPLFILEINHKFSNWTVYTHQKEDKLVYVYCGRRPYNI
jgi:hypothetical protein